MYREVSLSEFTVAGLAHRCRQETERYFRRLEYDERYCFELFRRAIAHGNQQAWSLLVLQYSRQVAAWIARHESFPEADEELDYFVNRSFARFWQAFSRDPQKLARFDSLKALLQYLKLCAYSAVKEHVERRVDLRTVHEPSCQESIPDDTSDPVASVDARVEAERIWRRVLEVVKTDQERIIAEAYLVHDAKPKEIYSWHPEAFDGVQQVRRVKDNLMARLRRDKGLLAILETA